MRWRHEDDSRPPIVSRQLVDAQAVIVHGAGQQLSADRAKRLPSTVILGVLDDDMVAGVYQQLRQQIEGLKAVRRERDNQRVKASLKRLEEVARGTENTMPAILECVEAYASIGEMCNVLRGVWGEQREYAFF
jgi:hypothetical protein